MVLNYVNLGPKGVAICGGGLVGCLLAIYLRKHGFDVSIYESREDPRRQQVVQKPLQSPPHFLIGHSHCIDKKRCTLVSQLSVYFSAGLEICPFGRHFPRLEGETEECS
jgi:hypothetical protein